MSLKDQVFVILGSFFLSMLYLRSLLSGIIRYQLNLSAYKKRKKRQTFREWLFYSRYKQEIPRILRVLYFTILIIHPACLIAGLFVSLNTGGTIAKAIWILDGVWMMVIALLFWSPGPGFAYERWIIRKRGQKRSRNKR